METKSVTVEWFERGETKGKEVGNLVVMLVVIVMMVVMMMIDQDSHVEKVLSIEVLTCSQIELEQILGLNQDLAPASYENANTIPNNNSKLKVRVNNGKIIKWHSNIKRRVENRKQNYAHLEFKTNSKEKIKSD